MPTKLVRYDVISPDGFSISRTEYYCSKAEAFAAFEKWKQNFEQQGYYSTADWEHIPVHQLHEFCTLVKIKTTWKEKLINLFNNAKQIFRN